MGIDRPINVDKVTNRIRPINVDKLSIKAQITNVQ